MTTIIHGIARSRAVRNLWMAYELGIPFEHDQVGFGPDGSRSARFLAINPNGHVPALSDDGLVLWELMAINLYLAKKAGGPLARLARRGRADDHVGVLGSHRGRAACGEALYNTSAYAPEKRDRRRWCGRWSH